MAQSWHPWALPTLPAGSTATFAITVQASPARKALLLTAAASGNPDPNPVHNIAIRQMCLARNPEGAQRA